MPSDIHPSTGDLFGRFLLLQPLFSPGAESDVHRTHLALDQESMEQVVVSTGPAPAGPVPQSFLAGLESAQGLFSASLPPVLDGGVEDGLLFQVAAWVPGIELRSLLPPGGLPLEISLPILWTLTGALSQLHARGLVHADIHPRNVRITPEGQIFLVGFAPPPLGAPRASQRPQAEEVRYAPPEWNQGNVLTAAGDVYSLGLLTYELFSGKRLLPPGTTARTYQNQLKVNTVIESSPSLSKLVPPAVQPVLRNMLRVDTTRRPRSARDLSEALVHAVPNWATTGSLGSLPPETLYSVLEHSARDLMARARHHLREGRAFCAASCLERTAELLETCPETHAATFDRLIEEALWFTFRLSGDRLDRPRQQALCLCLHRAAEASGNKHLRNIAGQRLGVFARRKGPLAHMLPRAENAETRERRRQGLVQLVRQNPTDGLALLGLATFSPGFHRDPSVAVATIKADLLEQEGLHAPALVHCLRDLEERSHDRDLLTRIRDLAEKALAATAPSGATPASRPPEIELPPGLSRPPPPSSRPPGPRPTGKGDIGDLLAAAPTTSPPRPPSEPEKESTSQAPPARQSVRPLTNGQIHSLLHECESHLGEGNFLEALHGYDRIRRGQGLQPRFLPQIIEQLRRIYWLVLHPANLAARDPEALFELVAVSAGARLESLHPVAERLLLDGLASPTERLVWCERVLECTPTSVAALRQAHEAAGELEEAAAKAGYLVRLGSELLDRGAVNVASPMFQAALTLDGFSQEAHDGLARARDTLERLPVVARDFQEIERKLESGELEREAAFAALDEFLDWHPNYLPAAERRATMALEVGDSATALRLNEKLATLAFSIEQMDLARTHFRRMLQCEPAHEEALLYLAYLNPLPADTEGDETDLRVALLLTEGMPGAAIHHARAKLEGGVQDLLVHEQLADLCRQAGLDPSPHLAAQGFLAMQAGENDLARQCFQEAVQESPMRENLVVALQKTDGIEQVFSPAELAAMKG